MCLACANAIIEELLDVVNWTPAHERALAHELQRGHAAAACTATPHERLRHLSHTLGVPVDSVAFGVVNSFSNALPEYAADREVESRIVAWLLAEADEANGFARRVPPAVHAYWLWAVHADKGPVHRAARIRHGEPTHCSDADNQDGARYCSEGVAAPKLAGEVNRFRECLEGADAPCVWCDSPPP